MTQRPNFLILDEVSDIFSGFSSFHPGLSNTVSHIVFFFIVSSQPTNDIDLDTLRGEVIHDSLMWSILLSFDFCSANFSFLPQIALEGYLEEFQGVLVVVSHDRLFTDKVCVRTRN